MPTPTGLPKVGEVWELAIVLPGRGEPVKPRRVVVIERSAGDYWALRVAYVERGVWKRALWVDASYHRQQGWLTYVGPAGPKTKAALGLG